MSEVDAEKAKRLVEELNALDGVNTEGLCPGRDWACDKWVPLKFCERLEQTCHCCDRHACGARS